MKFFKRMLLVGALAGTVSMIAPVQLVCAQEPAGTKITEDQLGQMLAALGLKPEKKLQRYDFAFQSDLEQQDWTMSLSAVLSQDGESLWIMAWLDPLPTSSADVPLSALLKLLAQNDQLGNGKFFAYIPGNRRFVLQRSIPNQNLTSIQLRAVLQDLGTSVVETYPIWHVENWNPKAVPAAPVGAANTPSKPGLPVPQSALNDSKFENPARR